MQDDHELELFPFFIVSDPICLIADSIMLCCFCAFIVLQMARSNSGPQAGMAYPRSSAIGKHTTALGIDMFSVSAVASQLSCNRYLRAKLNTIQFIVAFPKECVRWYMLIYPCRLVKTRLITSCQKDHDSPKDLVPASHARSQPYLFVQAPCSYLIDQAQTSSSEHVCPHSRVLIG